jgi:hypothetical protein
MENKRTNYAQPNPFSWQIERCGSNFLRVLVQGFASLETPQSQMPVLTLQTHRPYIVVGVKIHLNFTSVVHKGNTKI